ncbi:DUF3164 family protein [uncultured Duncaniella sp.]|uniref:DUF3164 family protein n=1 Tax=uncultured Duncaniella sp. TaxID=2768039 RepID=UPI0025D23550|nr:DUF3164 family protein [uncultured Duncaniella sp.]
MEQVQMTAEERQRYEAWKAEDEKKQAAAERKRQREEYATMVDDEINTAIPQLRELSESIKTVKDTVFGNFDAILKMKAEILGLTKDDQRSHTFTNSDSSLRITLGVNCIDGYRDTVEDGIAMVKAYIESLATDDKSKVLVSAVLRLLSRDGQGNLKASRVLQLRKMAEESGDERFIEGVRIIEESYQPTVTKRYIRAEYKDSKGAWRYIPLDMTAVDQLTPEP